MKFWQEKIERDQTQKLQFKRETIEVTIQDAEGNDIVEKQEVLSLLWSSNVLLPNCDVQMDWSEVTKTKLKDLQDWNFIDREKKIRKKELKKEAKQEVQVTE